MPLFAAIIGGVASLGAAAITSSSADKSRKATEKATARAEGYLAPYRETGTQALGSLATAYGLGDPNTLGARRDTFNQGFEASPLYRYAYEPALAESTDAYMKYASAAGKLNSGGTLKALQDRAATLGGQTIGSYLGGLGTLANNGQNAAAGTGSIVINGTNTANQYGQNAADSIGAGIIGVGSAFGKGMENYGYQRGLSAYSNPWGGNGNAVTTGNGWFR